MTLVYLSIVDDCYWPGVCDNSDFLRLRIADSASIAVSKGLDDEVSCIAFWHFGFRLLHRSEFGHGSEPSGSLSGLYKFNGMLYCFGDFFTHVCLCVP